MALEQHSHKRGDMHKLSNLHHFHLASYILAPAIQTLVGGGENTQLFCLTILSLQWPFVRFLGIQEPASVLFSIFNAVGHILGWRMFQSAVSKTDYEMHLVWKINLAVRQPIYLSILFVLFFSNHNKS